MNFLLKIVRGPNAGAEIALVEGLCISVGKSDACDIVLADATLPDEPLQLETSADSVVLSTPGTGREHLQPFHVATFGTTSFAVGPAEGPWEPLVWPEEKAEAPAAESAEAAPAAPAAAPAETPPAEKAKKASLGLVGKILLGLLALALLALLAFFLLRGCAGEGGIRDFFRGEPPAEEPTPAEALAEVAEKYALAETNRNGRTVYVRNFASRAERLAATGEMYAAAPGVALDFSDDESFRAAAEDLVFTLTEGALAVSEATNRVLSLSGTVSDPATLEGILEALSRDLPRLDRVLCDKVRWSAGAAPAVPAASAAVAEPPAPAAVAAAEARRRTATLPVCGILSRPWPCLVLRDGRRVFPGAALGNALVVSIAPDSVVLSNANGTFTWNP